MKHYINAFRNYANFNGRARRTEYWMFFIINSILGNTISYVSFEADLEGVYYLFLILVLIPGLAVGVRRMHDTGKSGWFLLVPIYNIILLFSPSEKGENQYGVEPD